MQPPPRPLSKPIRSSQRRLKFGLLAFGLGMTLFAGIAAFVMIVTPLVFRGLSEQDQQRVVRRLPFMRVFMPTSEVPGNAVLPTVAVTAGDALALLGTVPPPTVPLPTVPPPLATDSLLTTVPPTVPPPTVPPPTVPPPTVPPPSATLIVPSATASASVTLTFTVTALPATSTHTATALPPTIAPPTEAPPTQAIATPALPTDAPAPTQVALLSTDTPPTIAASATVTASATISPVTATPLPALPTNTAVPPSATSIPPTATLFPTETPLPTNTLIPTATFTFTPAPPTLIATPTDAVLPVSFSLVGKVVWEPQLWNNCGPANLVQTMRYMRWRDTQATVAGFLKPNQNDKNVNPSELVAYVNSRTKLRAVARVAGSFGLLKLLITQGYGVIIETGYIDPEEVDKGWIGHYMSIIGYDDAAQTITWMDSLYDVQSDGYAAQQEYWRHFNRVYIVLYPPEREAELAALLGANMDETYNAQQSLDLAKAEASFNPSDAYAWFNLGTSFAMLKRYGEAARAYDQAFSLGVLPYRHTWYQFGFYEAYYHTGQYQRVLDLAAFNLDKMKNHEETPFYWRGMVYAAVGRSAEAITEFQEALAFNKNFAPAALALQQVRDGSFQAPPISR
jgi:Peptidase_C39 like family